MTKIDLLKISFTHILPFFTQFFVNFSAQLEKELKREKIYISKYYL